MSDDSVARTLRLIAENAEHIDLFLFIIELDGVRRGNEPTEEMRKLMGDLTQEQRVMLYNTLSDHPKYLTAYQEYFGPAEVLLG